MNLHTALPIAVGAGVILTGLLAWLTFRPEKHSQPASRLDPTPAPNTQGIRDAYGWSANTDPELLALTYPAHPSVSLDWPLNLPIVTMNTDDLVDELVEATDGDD